MSEATRSFALQEANKREQFLSAVEVVAAAKVFDAFLAAPGNVVTAASAAGAEPGKKAEGKPSANTAGAKKLTANKKTEEQLAEEALAAAEAESNQEDADEENASIPRTKEGVEMIIAKLLKAKLRDEAITLLKKYKAASVSGVKEKDYVAFVTEGSKLLPAEGDGEEDLTA